MDDEVDLPPLSDMEWPTQMEAMLYLEKKKYSVDILNE